VDSAWEQKELEARKRLEKRAESHLSGAPMNIARDHFIREKQGRKKSILQNGKQVSRTKQWRAFRRLPWCTVVSGQIDLNTGGAKVNFFVEAQRPR
jgi:hypothetical protein